MIKDYGITLDTIEKVYNPSLTVNTNDLNSLRFVFAVQEDGELIDLTGLTVRIAIAKPDKKTVFQDCEVTDAENGKCEVILTTQAYVVSGKYVGELMIFDESQNITAVTGRFTYTAVKGVLDNSTIESTNEWQIINKVLDEAEQATIDANNAADRADTQGTYAKNQGDYAKAEADRVAGTDLSTHYVDTMPHQIKDLDSGKTYKYGLQVQNGVTQFIYEEVV